MDQPWQPEFVYAACQHGAESTLKRELALRAPLLRLAYSRPGFVTFKFDAAEKISVDEYHLPSAFARTSGFSLGGFAVEKIQAGAQAVWNSEEVVKFSDGRPFAGIHVWQRDQRAPGDHGFEPGPTPLALEVEQALRECSPIESLRPHIVHRTPHIPRNSWVLDVVLVEPNQWRLGCHRATNRTALWPGGVPPIELPDHAVSRAYLKMAEALAWSALPMSLGEVVVELGCAPGGASQALLDSGLAVIGVDPAEVDADVLAHPRFTHVRARTQATPRKAFRGVRWLAADMNVAPTYTLDAVEAAVMHAGAAIRGLLLTLKLAEWELADELPAYMQRVRGWGYKDVRIRQLAFNRQEVCLAALRSRSQRRVLRAPTQRRQRRDDPHPGVPAPHVAEPPA